MLSFDNKETKAPAKKKLMTKEKLVKKLTEEVCNIVFTTTGGAERFMRCTLVTDFLPKKDVGKLVKEQMNDESNKTKDDVIAVWDMDAKGWRSFKVENLVSIERNATFG